MAEMSYYPPTASPGPAEGTGTLGPVLVAVGAPTAQRRASVAFRIILAIPHLVVLYVLGIAAFFVVVIGWFGALFTGRLPSFAVIYLSGYLRWYSRTYAYLLLLTDEYPPFGFEDAAYPVRVEVGQGNLSRITVLFRFFLAIPAAIVSALLAYGVSGILIFIAWLIALVTGRLPGSLYQAFAAVFRYIVRYNGYLLLLTDSYPAGLFGDEPVTQAAAGPLPGGPGYGTPGYATPAPGYGTPAPGDGAPGYGAPGYGAPGYGAPGYGAPGYGAPGYGAPGYGAPGYGTPGYGTPGWGTPAPGYGTPAPGEGTPGYGTPGYGTPEYGTPGAPGYGTPGYGTPGYGTSSPQYPAPWYPAPAAGYGAPGGPAGYATPQPPGYPARTAPDAGQAASWQLVLSASAKRLVVLILVLGLLTLAGEGALAGVKINAVRQRDREISQLNADIAQHNAVVARHNAAVAAEKKTSAEVNSAITRVGDAYDTLGTTVNDSAKKANSCTTVSCFNAVGQGFAGAFTVYGRTLNATPVPSGSAAIEKRLSSDNASNERYWTEISQATSFDSIQSLINADTPVANALDSDDAALMKSLNQENTTLGAQAFTLNQQAATLNKQAAALNKRAATLNVTVSMPPAEGAL